MTSQKKGSETSCSPTRTGSQSVSKPTGTLGGCARAHPLVVKCVCAAIFLIVVYYFLVCDSSLAKLVEYNRSDLMMLGCEMLTEGGPRLQDAAKRHADLLRKYRADMKPRRFAGRLALLPLYSKYRPEKGIDAALATLDSVDGNDFRENAAAVWKAGEQLMHFRDETSAFFRRIGRYEPGRIPEPLLKNIEDANAVSMQAWLSFEESRTLLDEYKTLLAAWRLCEANRRTMLRIFAGRGYDCQKGTAERFSSVAEQFEIIAANAARGKREWAQTLKETGAKSELAELAEMLAESEERRCKILQAMGANKMNEAHELMWGALEKAMKIRERVLEIAQKLEAETRHWEAIRL